MSDEGSPKNDPFFTLPQESEWNACIGRQGDEENYLDGYIEAAIELSRAVLEKKLIGQRDTLVLPILYNARHGIELALKFTASRLISADVIRDVGHRVDHNIEALWKHLKQSELGDSKLSEVITCLEPYIISLSKLDEDGQELRYHTNRKNDPSLRGYSLANIKCILDSTLSLKEIIDDLKYRTIEYIYERKSGTYTRMCSRMDLINIAGLLPARQRWRSIEFDQAKKKIKKKYGLGNRQFSLALDKIQEQRETKSIISIETDLLYISDSEVIHAVREWRKLHPESDDSPKADEGLDYFDGRRFEEMKKRSLLYQDVISSIRKNVDSDAIAELEAMFYLGRDHVFVEYYESMVERTINEHKASENNDIKISHIMEKTNFLQCLRISARKLGRLKLTLALEVE